jgi:guanine deaminase
MEKSREKIMSSALQLAADNMDSMNGGPFGAVVVKDGEIIATAVNSVLELNDPTAHAEIVAIRKACEKLNDFQLTGCEIYSSCEPCPMCMGAIYWARPDRVYYAATRKDAAQAGFDDDFIYAELAKDIGSRNMAMEQLLHKEAKEIFDQWKELNNGIKY